MPNCEDCGVVNALCGLCRRYRKGPSIKDVHTPGEGGLVRCGQGGRKGRFFRCGSPNILM